MTYQYQWILDEILAGKTLPPRWPEPGEEGYVPPEEEEAEVEYTRSWEVDGGSAPASGKQPQKGGR